MFQWLRTSLIKPALQCFIEQDSFTELKNKYKGFKERSGTQSVKNIILRSLDRIKTANFGILCSTDDF